MLSRPSSSPMRTMPHRLVLVSPVLMGAVLVACQSEAPPDATAVEDAPAAEEAPVATAAPEPELTCATGEACRYDGRCSGEPPECEVGDDEDCRRSQGCRDWGLCTAEKGTAEKGRCVADSADDCRESYTCKMTGRCTPEQGTCAVVEEDDCRGAYICRYERKCVAKNGYCRK